MTHIITRLCVRDNGCMAVCPVECINPGEDMEKWPTYYIDPATCIDCGACVPECPYHAIYPEDEVPAAFIAEGGEVINQPGLTGHYANTNHHKDLIVLDTTRVLEAGEQIDLRDDIQTNYDFYS